MRVCQVYTAPMSVRAQARMVQAGVPFPRQYRMLMSCYRPRLLVCVCPPPIRLWRVCALPQTHPLYALSALSVVRVSLFRNTGARAYICCVCFQIYMCADPRRLEFLAEVSCAYLVRHAQSAGGKYNFAELLAAGKTGGFRTEEYTLCKFKFTTYACAKHITLPTVECKNLTVECNLKA